MPVAGFTGTYTPDANFGSLTIGGGADGKALRVENSSGYGLHASMNAGGTTLCLDNQKPFVGFSDMNIRANNLALWGGSAASPVQTLSIGAGGVDIVGKMGATGEISSSSPTAGVGYRAGAGGTVNQATSKSTGVTLNKASGQLTMHSAALAAGTSVSFTLTNSAIAATDVVIVNIGSGASASSYAVTVDAAAAGSCRIQLRNISSASLGEALVINFAVVKAVAN